MKENDILTIKPKQNWICDTPRTEVKKHHELLTYRQDPFYFHIKVSHDLWLLRVHKINIKWDYIYLTLPYRYYRYAKKCLQFVAGDFTHCY